MAEDNTESQRRDDAEAAHAAVLADLAKAGWGPTVRFSLMDVGHRLPLRSLVLGLFTVLTGGGGALVALARARGWLA